MGKPVSSVQTLHKLLRCDPDAGILHWRARTPDMFNGSGGTPSRLCNTFNTVHAGSEALTNYRTGYKGGCILGRSYQAHRVIWAMTFGKWPEVILDHINGIRDDNRIINLREVTHSQNSRNIPIRSNNKSGEHGASWNSARRKWMAGISVDGRYKLIGYYDDLSEAGEARRIFSDKYGFTIRDQ